MQVVLVVKEQKKRMHLQNLEFHFHNNLQQNRMDKIDRISLLLVYAFHDILNLQNFMAMEKDGIQCIGDSETMYFLPLDTTQCQIRKTSLSFNSFIKNGKYLV